MKLALYGTLMRGCGAAEKVSAGFRFEGPCRIRGVLGDLGDYPGLTEGEGEVIGELYTILDEAALSELDAYEDEGALYLRKRARLIEPEVEAWVYVYNQTLGDAELIPSGCWRMHLLRRGGSRPG